MQIAIKPNKVLLQITINRNSLDQIPFSHVVDHSQIDTYILKASKYLGGTDEFCIEPSVQAILSWRQYAQEGQEAEYRKA